MNLKKLKDSKEGSYYFCNPLSGKSVENISKGELIEEIKEALPEDSPLREKIDEDFETIWSIDWPSVSEESSAVFYGPVDE